MTRFGLPAALFGFQLVATMLVGGCVTDENAAAVGTEGQACVPGMAISCVCPDGNDGARGCDDGGELGACVCDGSDPSASGPSGGTDNPDPSDSDSDATASGPGSDTADGTDSGEADTWDGAEIPSWSEHIIPFFELKCGANNAVCHRREIYATELDRNCLGWTALEDASIGSEIYGGDDPPVGSPTGCPNVGLYDRLVDRSPWGCGAFTGQPTNITIVPGDPDASYLLTKMLGGPYCGEGERMPPAESEIVVTDMEIEMVRRWIADGALDN